MRKAIILAAGLALIGTSAAAQGWRDRDDDDRRGWREERREGRDRDDMRGRRHHHDDDSSAARFVLRSGEARMAVRCDERESMRACVDAALTLFDRVRTQGAASGATSPASPAPSTPAPAR